MSHSFRLSCSPSVRAKKGIWASAPFQTTVVYVSGLFFSPFKFISPYLMRLFFFLLQHPERPLGKNGPLPYCLSSILTEVVVTATTVWFLAALNLLVPFGLLFFRSHFQLVLFCFFSLPLFLGAS